MFISHELNSKKKKKIFKGFKDILQRYEKKNDSPHVAILILYVAMLYSLKSLHFKLKQMDVRLFFFTLFMTVVYRVTYARTYRFPSTFISLFSLTPTYSHNS